MSFQNSVRSRIRFLAKGKPFSSSAFFDLGKRGAIDLALSRLERQKLIVRVAHGIYVRPRQTSVGQELPSLKVVLDKVAKENNEEILMHGAESARLLGLTTQMPARDVFYTTGSSRKITILNTPVKLIHTKRAKIRSSNEKIRLVISALLYFGKANVGTAQIEQVLKNLNDNEKRDLRIELLQQPQWLREAFALDGEDKLFSFTG